MNPTRAFALVYYPLFEKVTGAKPKLTSRDWFFIKRWYEQNFYECVDIMEAVIREYFGSGLGTKGGYSIKFLTHKNVTLELLDNVRERMKRTRQWEQGSYTKEEPRIVDAEDQELTAMMERLQKQAPGMGYDAYLRMAKQRLNK
jgi:hypothetical protein